MDMRKSRVLRKLRAGEVAVCTKLNLNCVRNAELAAMCGVDCIWIDMEHIPTDWMFVEDSVRAAKIYDCDVLTRVAKGAYNDFIRPLEADSTGIMVPHLMSLKEAKEIAYFTKFHPIGRRPIDGGNADGKFCLVDTADYMKQANEERFIVVQIEDPEPMAELDEICQVPGIDMIFFGPGDFSQGIGAANSSDPRVAEARKIVAATARKYGKYAGTVGSPANFESLIEMGYQFISIGADVCALSDHYQAMAKMCGYKAKEM